MKDKKKMKKRTKIIIGIIITFCIIMICGYFYVRYEQSQIKPLTLSTDQITTDSHILNEFMTAINNNNEEAYKELTTGSISTNNTFEEIVKECTSDFGEFKSATYEKAVRSGPYDILLFDANFTNKNNVEIIVSMDSNSKIAGINLK